MMWTRPWHADGGIWLLSSWVPVPQSMALISLAVRRGAAPRTSACDDGAWSAAVHARAADIRRALTRLTERLAKGGASVMQDISPAFEWAESPTSVFLNVKFSAKVGFDLT